ncbi:MAG: exodeoxyribonuclease VII large subunit [Prevotellaceae bacterium]|jgi:exodeoxyribonuclease VII large subunit|nr:exodeoxyribonuclease VII large subunit [Prevotellaceae bacterium]
MHNFVFRITYVLNATIPKSRKFVNDALTLSEMQQRIKQTLEETLPDNYWITAEINEIKTNASGHCYLELVEKDDEALKARASAAIWVYSYRLLKPFFETSTGRPLSAGMRVLVKAAVQYHPVYGLSLSITDIDPVYTVGELEMQRRRTISRLQSDGVFDMNRELPFPLLPQRLAVISSEQAAGYQDFMDQLHHNKYGYAFHTQLFPSLMQGAGAVQSIIQSLALVNEQCGAFDAVAIIRGGGSATDLSCFDDYELALHVAQFPLPVLTGIGHDKDESVVDLVARQPLKTPTAVAGFLIECFAEQDAQLQQWEQALRNMVRQKIQMSENALTVLASRRDTAVKLYFQKERNYLELAARTIQYNNPQTILARGYSIVSLNGKTVRDAATVHENDELKITLYKGRLRAKVQPGKT